MAQHILPEHLDELEAKGRELFATATGMAGQYTLMLEGGPEANEIATKVQAMVLAIDGLLTGSELGEGLVMIALGAASGCALGKCVGDRRILMQGFKDQMGRSLAEVTQAMEPQGTA